MDIGAIIFFFGLAVGAASVVLGLFILIGERFRGQGGRNPDMERDGGAPSLRSSPVKSATNRKSI